MRRSRSPGFSPSHSCHEERVEHGVRANDSTGDDSCLRTSRASSRRGSFLTLGKMKSVFWLIPNSVAGRPGPQWEPWSVADIRAAGFDAVVNLSEHAPDMEAFETFGIESSWVPLPGDIPPTDAAQEQFVAALPRALAFVSAQVTKGRRVLIHCHGGRDRTGMLLAVLVAKRDGLTAAAAIRRVREVRPTAITAEGWEDLALRVIPRVVATLP